MVVADDELDAAHAAVHEVVQEGPPMNLRLRQGHRDAEKAPPAIGSDADGRQDRGIADDGVSRTH